MIYPVNVIRSEINDRREKDLGDSVEEINAEIEGMTAQLENLRKQRGGISLLLEALAQPAYLVLTRYKDNSESGDPGYFFEKGEVLCIDGSECFKEKWDEGVIVEIQSSIRVIVFLDERKSLGQPRRIREFMITRPNVKIVFAMKQNGTALYCVELLTGPEARSTAEDIAKNGYPGSWREDEFVDLKETR